MSSLARYLFIAAGVALAATIAFGLWGIWAREPRALESLNVTGLALLALSVAGTVALTHPPATRPSGCPCCPR